METVVNPQDSLRRKLYEAMFLIDSAKAASDWDGINATVKTILEKAEAEIVSTRKWSECKLAYEIDHKTRGTYILVYFRADGGRIGQIERDVQLCEQIMRVLILNAEGRSKEDIERDTPATRIEKRSQKIAQEAAQKDEAKQKAEAKQTGEAEQAGEAEQTVEVEQAGEAEQTVSEKQPQEAEESDSKFLATNEHE